MQVAKVDAGNARVVNIPGNNPPVFKASGTFTYLLMQVRNDCRIATNLNQQLCTCFE